MAGTLSSHKRLFLLVIFLLYLAARVGLSLPAFARPRQLADTYAYVFVSKQPAMSDRFWASVQPAGFPLLLKIAGQDMQAVAGIQLGLSIIGWACLALMLSTFSRRPWLSLLSFTWILVLSLAPHLAGWDFTMVSESLSITCFVLFVACGLWLLRGWSWGKAALWCAAALLMVFTRDANVYLLLALTVLLLGAVLLGWADRRILVPAVVFILIFLLANASINAGQRWVNPVLDVVGRRVLRDPGDVNFLRASCGMPVSPELMALRNQFATGQEKGFYENPALADFRAWFLSRGRECYARLLLADPVHSLREPLVEFSGLITFRQIHSYLASRFDPLVPYALEPFFYPIRNAFWIWLLLSLAALLVLFMQSWKQQPLWSAFILLSLTIFPHLFVAWHGDALTPYRQSLLVGLQLALAAWVLMQLLLDQIAARPAALDIT